MMYRIEVVEKKRKRKLIILIAIIIPILMALAVFSGIKVAEHEYLSKRENIMNFSQEKNYNNAPNIPNNENNNSSEEEKGNNNQSIVNNNKENEQTNTGETSKQNEVDQQSSDTNEVNQQPSNQNESGSQNSNNEPEQNQNETDTQNPSNPISQNQALTDSQIKAINSIYSSDTKRVFLTFDDGPSSTVTPTILDTLKKENIKATFFVLGTMVKSNPEMIKREKEEGHYIANHGYSHVYKKVYENENKPLEEYNKTNVLIQNALNDPTFQSSVFRFPGGSNGGYYDDIKTKAKKVLEKNHVAYLDWNCLTNDSAGATTEEEMLKNLKSTAKGKNSVVVLMHDAPNKKQTAKTLPKIIKYFKDNGYTFQNLYDIL